MVLMEALLREVRQMDMGVEALTMTEKHSLGLKPAGKNCDH